MNVNANNNMGGNNILDKTIDINPVGVIYNLTSEIIEDYVEQYLASKGVDNISRVKLMVRNEGKTSPYVALYLFLNKNSSAIVSNINSIPPVLRDKIDKVSVSMSDEFKKVVTPLTGNDIESGRAEGADYYVKLNIFRAIGMMLSADPRKHNLVITDAKRLPRGNSVISVLKGTNYNYGGSSDNDKYSRQVDSLEKRHR